MKAPSGRRVGAGLVNVAFLCSAAASVGLIVLYLLGGQPQAEGALLLVALGGIGIGLIVWAHRFLPQGPYVQGREPLASTEEERRAFAESFERRGRMVGRRSFLGMLGLALGALGAAALFPIRSLGPSPGKSLFRTKWRRGSLVVGSDGSPVTVLDLPVGSVLTVFPQGFVDSADSAGRPGPPRATWPTRRSAPTRAVRSGCTRPGPSGCFVRATSRCST